MTDALLTLIATPPLDPITPAHLDAVRDALRGLGGVPAEVTWLADGIAVDLPVDRLDAEQAEAAATAALGEARIDVVAQRAELLAARRKRLLIADMDATMVAEETLDELAGEMGLKDKIAAITARAMAGELDFEAAVTERVGLLAGLSLDAVDVVKARLRYTPGGRTLVQTMAAGGARCLLVSGGFTLFTGPVAAHLGFHAHYGNQLAVADGALTGALIPPIRGADAKRETLIAEAGSALIPLDHCVGVGDGANDIPMLTVCGLGVAFRAKPRTAAAANARITHSDLTALLYAQGYRADEFQAEA